MGYAKIHRGIGGFYNRTLTLCTLIVLGFFSKPAKLIVNASLLRRGRVQIKISASHRINSRMMHRVAGIRAGPAPKGTFNCRPNYVIYWYSNLVSIDRHLGLRPLDHLSFKGGEATYEVDDQLPLRCA